VRTAVVTGSSGLIGSETVALLDGRGWRVEGIDNNQRQVFFGADGDTGPNLERLLASTRRFTSHAADIQDRAEVERQRSPT
jgi:CDP-paratose 2-epimerase